MSRKVFWIYVEECQGLKPEPYKYSQSSRLDMSVWVRESVTLVHKVQKQKVFWVAYMSENNKAERLNLLIILNILAKILFWREFQTVDPSIFEYLSHQCTDGVFNTGMPPRRFENRDWNRSFCLLFYKYCAWLSGFNGGSSITPRSFYTRHFV